MNADRTKEESLPRVLIVEEDPDLAMALVNECLDAGLEPKLCMGPAKTSSCPGLQGDGCPRVRGVEATFLSVTSGRQRAASPACAGGRLVLSGERPLVGAATISVLKPDAAVEYPYEPHAAASLLFSLVKDERRRPGDGSWERGSAPVR